MVAATSLNNNANNNSNSRPSVDDIWRALKASTNTPAKQPPPRTPTTTSTVTETTATATVTASTSPVLIATDPTTSTSSSFCSAVASYARSLATAGSAKQKKEIIAHVRKLLLHNAEDQSNSAELEEGVEVIGKALVRRFEDSSEQCRELAVSTLAELLEACPSATHALLPYVVPALQERLHRTSKGPAEPSEEVRVRLLQLLRTLLRCCAPHEGGAGGGGKRALAPYAADICGALTEATAGEDHPDALLEAYGCVRDLCGLFGPTLKPLVPPLSRAVRLGLGRRRGSVRLAALQAVRELVVCHGGGEEILELTAWRDPNLVPIKSFYEADIKVNYMGLLAQDSNPLVREEFIKTLTLWLTELPDRREHHARLLPYVLSAVCDDHADIATTGFESLCEEDRYEEMRDLRTYHSEESGPDYASAHVQSALPHPLPRRPCLGARTIVKEHFFYVAKPLLSKCL
eukprot:jgi/Chlat1/2839/Chrsp194S02999